MMLRIADSFDEGGGHQPSRHLSTKRPSAHSLSTDKTSVVAPEEPGAQAIDAYVRDGHQGEPWYKRYFHKDILCSERCKPLYPYAGFLAYIFIGSAVLYAIEVNLPLKFNFRRSRRPKDCIGGTNYWAAFSYVISATSTIGMLLQRTQGSIRRGRRRKSGPHSPKRTRTPSPEVEVVIETVSIQEGDTCGDKFRYYFTKCQTPCCTYAFIFLYIIIGASFLLLLEIYITPKLDFARPQDLNKCLSTNGFWSALFFMVATSSTIGFGNVYPCTDVGRAISTVYSIIGVPMVVYILTNFGKHLCVLVSIAYPKVRAKIQSLRESRGISLIKRKETSEAPLKDEAEVEYVNPEPFEPPKVHHDTTSEDELEIPTTIGVLLTLSCVGMIGVYYYNYEDYDFEDSVYYAFMTFLGGDFVTEKFHWVVPVYFTIFLGFSMLSLTISIFQSNLEKFIDRLKNRLTENVTAQIAAAKAASQDPSSIDVDSTVEDAMNKTKAPWYMKALMPKREMDLLKDAVSHAVNKKDHGAQASMRFQRRIYQTADGEAQCGRPDKGALGTQTNTPNHVEVSTEKPEVCHSESQSEMAERKDSSFDVKPPRADSNLQCKPARTDAGMSTKPPSNSVSIATTGPPSDASTMTEFETGTVEVQAALSRPPPNVVMSPKNANRRKSSIAPPRSDVPNGKKERAVSTVSFPARKVSTASLASAVSVASVASFESADSSKGSEDFHPT